MKDLKFTEYNSEVDRFYKFISMLIITLLVISLMYVVSFSWFGETKDVDDVITVGQISISVTSDLDFTGVLLEPLKTYNKTTTITGSQTNTNDALIKVKLTTSLKTEGGQNIVNPIYNTNNWVYDGSEWYYFKGFVNKDVTATFNTALQTSYDITNSLTNQPFTVKITVSAIQKDYDAYLHSTDWSNAPSEWITFIESI